MPRPPGVKGRQRKILSKLSSHGPPTTTAVIVFSPARVRSVLNYIADAAIAEGSQRMLAQVNARMEAQRRGRGGGSGVLGSWGAMEENVTSQDDSTTVHAIDQSQIRNLAEKHGIVVRFVDDGAASGVSQVRALARAHGIRILVVGEDGGGGCSDGHGEEEEALAAGGNGGAARSASATPPPTLSSLRTQAAPARRSPSPTPTVPTKVCAAVMMRPS